MIRYTSLDQVKQRLKRSQRDRVRFPGAPDRITALEGGKYDSSDYITNISIDHSKIYSSPDFEGSLTLQVNFTSATDFEVYKTYVGGRDFRPMLDGVGTVGAQYDLTTGEATIEADAFGGTPEVGQFVKIEWQVHISEERAELLIEDVETYLNSEIRKHLVDPASLRADKELELVTNYMAAYYIYVDVFLSNNVQEDGPPGFVNRWKRFAEKVFENLLKEHMRDIGGVEVNAFPSMISSIGQLYVSSGQKQLTDRYDPEPMPSEGVFNSDISRDPYVLPYDQDID